MNPRPRRQTYKSLVKRWWPAITWAGVIFFFSTDYFAAPHTARFLTPFLTWLFPAVTPEQTAFVHLVLRKFGHWSEYFIFAVLLMSALKGDLDRWPTRRRALWTIAVLLAYAASDEFHQSFVASRSATVTDVIIDLSGGLCGTLWICLRQIRGRGGSISSHNAHERTSRPSEVVKKLDNPSVNGDDA